MQRDFLVESRSYDQVLRGSWRAYSLAGGIPGTESNASALFSEATQGMLTLWLPAGTLMHWAAGTRSLRYSCLQFYWPERWYMLSAFYQNRTLLHTYAMIIQPPALSVDRLSYVDLDLSVLVKPDLSYEVLTQAEFEYTAEMLHYDEQTRISALMALRTLTSSIQRSVGVFTVVPQQLSQSEFHLVSCGEKS
jgi:protein associated with RNAse G/E